MAEKEIGFTKQNIEFIAEGYDRICELYKRISYYDMLEIKRCYPVYFRTYEDTERDIDRNGANMSTPQFKFACEKMVATWENIVQKIEIEVNNNCKRGMPRPVAKGTYSGLAIYRDDLVWEKMIRVGYCTPKEIKDWLDKKITIAELIERNKKEHNDDLGRRFNKGFMIYCELSNDGSLDIKQNRKEELSHDNFLKEVKTIEPMKIDNTKPLGENFDKLKSKPIEQKKDDIFELETTEEELTLNIKTGWE